MTIIKKISGLILISLIILSCGKLDKKTYDDINQMVACAKKNITKININDFKAIFDNKTEKVVIIDCREQKEYEKKHIPGAINVPRGLIEFSNKISDRRKQYYIYSNTDKRAALACDRLSLLKYSNVILIGEGWEKWTELFPDLFEEGLGNTGKKAPKIEESGGCGG